MIAQRNAETEPGVDPVAIDLPNVVGHPRRAKHGAGDSGAHGQIGLEAAHTLGPGHDDLVARQERLVLVEEGSVSLDKPADGVEPLRTGVDPAAAETLVVAHHTGPAQRFEKVENPFPLAEGVHERRPAASAVLHQEAGEAGVVLEARQLGQDDTDVLRPFGNGLADEFFDGERVRPVVRHRIEVIEPVRVGHRTEVGRILAELLVIAMEVPEYRLQPDDGLAVQGDHHPEHTVGRRVVRPHRHLEEIAVESVLHRPHTRAGRGNQRTGQILDHGAPSFAPLRGASAGVGS